jgi:hypothetical protein
LKYFVYYQNLFDKIYIQKQMHWIINWNPVSTTVSESGIQDVESGIQGVGSGIQAAGSGIQIPTGLPHMGRDFTRLVQVGEYCILQFDLRNAIF